MTTHRLVTVPAALAGPPNGTVTDDTPTVRFAPGSTITVANRSYAQPGAVSSVAVDLGSDARAVDAVPEVRVGLFDDSGPASAVATATYDRRTVTVAFDRTVSNVSRIVVVAPTVDDTPIGTTLNATYRINGSDDVATTGTATATAESGFMTGRVTDQDNRDVADAVVTATRTDHAVTRTVETNDRGDYTVELGPGTYTVEASKEFYRPVPQRGVTVAADDTTTQDLLVRRTTGAVRLTVTPRSQRARSDGAPAVFTVTAFDLFGDPIPDQRIEPRLPSLAMTAEPETGTTGPDGQVTFRIGTDADFRLERNVTFVARGPDAASPAPTAEARVVFLETENPRVDPYVENLTVPDAVASGDSATIATGIENREPFPVEEPVRVRYDADGDGLDGDDPVLSRPVSYDAGERVSLRFTIPGTATAGGDPVAIRIRTSTDSREGRMTVVDPIVARFDRGGDRMIDLHDVAAAIRAFDEDRPVDGRPVTLRDVSRLIERFDAGERSS
ncbi:hypothetical protein BRD17_01615 [Halobacteriales archaeon SW_7_68_16]|nr:MAG: hypothetical protein BRD17_01615 [Halobacteriales archaeon SW_7_68_16]